MAVIDGGELLVRTLVRAGVDTVFALSGGHLDPVFISASEHGIRIVAHTSSIRQVAYSSDWAWALTLTLTLAVHASGRWRTRAIGREP